VNVATDHPDHDHLRRALRLFAWSGLAGALVGLALAILTVPDTASPGRPNVIAFATVVALGYLTLGLAEPRLADRRIPVAYAIAAWLSLVTIIRLTSQIPVLNAFGDVLIGILPVGIALFARWPTAHQVIWCSITLVAVGLAAAVPDGWTPWTTEARPSMVAAFAAGAVLSIAGTRVLDQSRRLARVQEGRIRAAREAERHAAEDLHRSERRYRQIVELSTEGIWVSDAAGRTTLANARAAEILGFGPGELQGRHVLEALEPEVRDHVQAYLGPNPPQEPMGDIPARRPDGSTVWLAVAATRLEDDSGATFGTLAMFTDVSERHAAELDLRASNEALDRLVSVDALTGVLNRRALDAAIAALSGSAIPVGILLIDIDRFKEFNDTNGHQAGDVALRSVADALAAALRPGDRIYRYGGEEFLVLLERVGASTAVAIAERARKAVAARGIAARPLDSDRVVTVSIGVTVGRPDSHTIESIISAADEALYDAKAGGRDRVVEGPTTRGRRRPSRPTQSREARGRAKPGSQDDLGPAPPDPV
jgi:diguanylate cyclase (GGDEF)-like protein/PAS domain S-box-containing protein